MSLVPFYIIQDNPYQVTLKLLFGIQFFLGILLWCKNKTIALFSHIFIILHFWFPFHLTFQWHFISILVVAIALYRRIPLIWFTGNFIILAVSLFSIHLMPRLNTPILEANLYPFILTTGFILLMNVLFILNEKRSFLCPVSTTSSVYTDDTFSHNTLLSLRALLMLSTLFLFTLMDFDTRCLALITSLSFFTIYKITHKFFSDSIDDKTLGYLLYSFTMFVIIKLSSTYLPNLSTNIYYFWEYNLVFSLSLTSTLYSINAISPPIKRCPKRIEPASGSKLFIAK